MNEKDLRSIAVADNLPLLRRPHEGDCLPKGLVGSRVVRIGTIADADTCVEGGGLVIDFIPDGASSPQRVVLAFNDQGMWVEALIEY